MTPTLPVDKMAFSPGALFHYFQEAYIIKMNN